MLSGRGQNRGPGLGHHVHFFQNEESRESLRKIRIRKTILFQQDRVKMKIEPRYKLTSHVSSLIRLNFVEKICLNINQQYLAVF